jgi:fermentation-respiration switch protein FrsA (DUF1100 family)
VAIVVGHQGGAVKEQAAGLYSGQPADKGLIALAYDGPRRAPASTVAVWIPPWSRGLISSGSRE